MFIFNMKLYIFYSIFSYILIQDISWYNIFSDDVQFQYEDSVALVQHTSLQTNSSFKAGTEY